MDNITIVFKHQYLNFGDEGVQTITVIIEELCIHYLTCIWHLYITELFGKPAFQGAV